LESPAGFIAIGSISRTGDDIMHTRTTLITAFLLVAGALRDRRAPFAAIRIPDFTAHFAGSLSPARNFAS
jgi:hypothetical protein